MLPIIVIGGLIVLFFAIRPSGSVDSGVPSGSGAGPNNGMPDPGATSNASMAGAAWQTVPEASGPPALPGTSKISPATVPALMNVTNRIAVRGIGSPGIARRVPTGVTVQTTNPAIVPFSAEGTRAFSGSVATTTTRGGGIKL